MAEEEFALYEEMAPEAEAGDVGEAPAEEAHAGAQATYTGVRISGFKDMLLRPELLKALSDAAFEHPSQVQHDCLHPATLGKDILCQAKAGMGKTAVFVLSTLHVLSEPEDDKPRVLVVAHTREMTLQIMKEYERFSKYIDFVRGRIMKVHGGVARDIDAEELRRVKPLIVIGTPGRLFDLVQEGPKARKALDLSKIEHFVIDECDRLLADPVALKQIVEMFQECPKKKQTMMFSATMPAETRDLCKKFLSPERLFEKYVDGDTKLTLHGLDQFYLKVEEANKIDALFKLLDQNRGYNQVIIFVNKTERAMRLGELMVKNSFPTYTICGTMPVEQRLATFEAFKATKQRFLVATEVFARGVDVQAVNLVINFDCPADRIESDAPRGSRFGAPSGEKKVISGSDQYLHRIGRAGRFGTRGAAVTFLSSADDVAMMNEVRTRFEVTIKEVKLDNIGDITKDLATSGESA